VGDIGSGQVAYGII